MKGYPTFRHVFPLIGMLALTGCQLSVAGPRDEAEPHSEAEQTPDGPQLVIDTTSLPGTYPRANYSVRLQQHGGVPPFHWRLEKGELPPGLKLEDDGTLHGSPEREGEYHFTVSLSDNSKQPPDWQPQGVA